MRAKAALARLAADIRADFGLNDIDAFDPMSWSEDNGVPFISLDEFSADPAARRRFTEERPEVWSAALLRDGMSHLVIYNSAHSPERTRSNLAHEVAHFEAEHLLSDAWMEEDGSCGGTSRSDEKEAAELAAAILVPAEMAKQHAIRSGAPGALAVRYGVSIQMAEWRMRVSGGHLIRDRAAAKRLGRVIRGT